MSTSMLLLTLLCGLTTVALVCVRRIPEGQAYTLRRVDGHLRTVGAGVHLVLPLIERVAHKIRLLGNIVDIAVSAADGDQHARVFFQVLDARRADAVIDGIADLLRERIPALTAQIHADVDTMARATQLKTELNRDLNTRGVLVTRVQLG
ncbi:MAG: SPFH domain-containing protein [Rudaea sp.]